MQEVSDDLVEEILKRLTNIESFIKEKHNSSSVEILDNSDFIQLLKISSRTARIWRKKGVIGYSLIGNKIYYKKDDVQKLLESRYKK